MKYWCYFFHFFFILAIFACKKPPETATIQEWSGKEEPAISSISLYDTIPSIIKQINIHEIRGIKAAYPSGAFTCYFEYDAEPAEMLKLISMLPFKRNGMSSDTIVRPMESEFSTSGKTLLTEEEISSSEFFWNIDPRQYSYYECVKNPVRHTILVNKNTGRILHRIESPA